MRSASLERSTCQRSQSSCKPSQKSALIPVTWAKRSAVSGVTLRFWRIISFSRGKDTPRRMAKADWDNPNGFRNSSNNISPGCTGGIAVGKRRRTSGRTPAERLVVVRDFDFVGIAPLPAKTDSVLFIDADAVLTAPISLETLQSIARRDSRRYAPYRLRGAKGFGFPK
jgi:hypothetical protein